MKKYRSFIFASLLIMIAVFFVCSVKQERVSAETVSHTVTFDFNVSRIKDFIPSTDQSLISSLSTYSVSVEDGEMVSENKDHYGLNLYYDYTWTVDGSAVNLASYPITQDTTFIAKWTPIEYTVTLKFASVAEKAQVTNLQPNIKFTIESGRKDFYRPNRPHYKFDGWFMAGDMTEWMYLPAGSVGDKILVARFTPIEYVINYNTELSGVLTPRTYNVEDRDITLVEATKEGHMFLGWYLDKTFTNPINLIDCSKGGNITLYPKWQLKTYTVKYIMPDGSMQYVETEYGKTAKAPSIEKNFLQIITTDVSRKNITEDTTIHVKLINIWYVYALGAALVLGLTILIVVKIIRKKQNHQTLRHFYHSNSKKK